MMNKLHIRSTIVAVAVAVAASLSLTGCGLLSEQTQPQEGQGTEQQPQGEGTAPDQGSAPDQGAAPDQGSAPDKGTAPDQGSTGSSNSGTSNQGSGSSGSSSSGGSSSGSNSSGGGTGDSQDTSNKASDTRVKIDSKGNGVIPKAAIEDDIYDLMKNKYNMKLTAVECLGDVKVYQGRGSQSCELKTPDRPYFGTVIVKGINKGMIQYQIKFPSLPDDVKVN
ncbi:hypothetical protein [Brevibacterium mcbrellneri]|uniref:hypothetical protein n=1 Tax=Brevibacterium mcbrellneri TaxID=53363 RepID=UPI00031D65D4|nr:hypothetical protein [Brevibacterium mcbrellneri]